MFTSNAAVAVSVMTLLVSTTMGCASSPAGPADLGRDAATTESGGRDTGTTAETKAGESCRKSDCSTGDYCNMAVSNCGALDVMGTCETIPTTCTEEFEPVCGCDGTTYPNACAAARASATVKGKGDCAGTPPEKTECGKPSDCSAGKYCDRTGSSCGALEILGACKPIPTSCTEEFEPVCGCDGKTYSNACQAARGSATVKSKGECAP